MDRVAKFLIIGGSAVFGGSVLYCLWELKSQINRVAENFSIELQTMFKELNNHEDRLQQIGAKIGNAD